MRYSTQTDSETEIRGLAQKNRSHLFTRVSWVVEAGEFIPVMSGEEDLESFQLSFFPKELLLMES